MQGADILVEYIKAQGVRARFGMPGTQNIHLYDAVLRRRDSNPHTRNGYWILNPQ